MTSCDKVMTQTSPLSSELLEKLERLQRKHSEAGQDLGAHLDGLLQTEFTNYWDYIRLESLLSLQTPRTAMPDEQAFIIFHQVSELYFKLCLLELAQIAAEEKPSVEFLRQRAGRVVGYLRTLTQSFDAVAEGMDPAQFRIFRQALLPASGFQSVQYRMIEIGATDLVNLVIKEKRDVRAQSAPVATVDVPGIYEELYWQQTDSARGVSQTLRQFNKKYAGVLIAFAETRVNSNLWRCYLRLSPAEREDAGLRGVLRELDACANIHWPLAHYKTALRHLGQPIGTPSSTGGTDWQRYLPPHFQRRIFYRELWSEQEREEWGRAWVDRWVG